MRTPGTIEVSERDYRALLAELEKARSLLARCETVLDNMAKENEGAVFNRWPIGHEPLRADAKNLLPEIRALNAD